MLVDTPTPKPDRRYVDGRLHDTQEIERWVFTFTNEARQAHGLPVLSHDQTISRIARAHSENMVATGVFSHDLNGQDPTDRALAAGYDCTGPDGHYGLGENIATEHRVQRWTCSGSDDSSCRVKLYHETEREVARGLVDGWMGSPGHRENILDRGYFRIGVGVAVEISSRYSQDDEGFYATQNFSPCR